MANKNKVKGKVKGKGKESELEVDQILSRSEQFIEKNKKNLLYGIAIVAALVGIILVYHYKYAIPLNERAERVIFKGEQYFERDSFALALFGNGFDFEGFEAIVDQYGRTKAGNLAKAYAGILFTVFPKFTVVNDVQPEKGCHDDELERAAQLAALKFTVPNCVQF